MSFCVLSMRFPKTLIPNLMFWDVWTRCRSGLIHWFQCKAKTDRFNTNTSYPLISNFITNPNQSTTCEVHSLWHRSEWVKFEFRRGAAVVKTSQFVQQHGKYVSLMAWATTWSLSEKLFSRLEFRGQFCQEQKISGYRQVFQRLATMMGHEEVVVSATSAEL